MFANNITGSLYHDINFDHKIPITLKTLFFNQFITLTAPVLSIILAVSFSYSDFYFYNKAMCQ